MSDMWPFSSSSSPPIMHHSSLSQPPPPLSHPRPQVTSPFLSSLKHVTSPQSVPNNQPTSCQNFPSSPSHPPLNIPPPQERSPLFSPSQGPSSNLSHPHFTSPHSVPQTPITSPPNVRYTPITPPENVRYTPITSPPNVRYTPITPPENVRYTPITPPENVRYTPITSPPNVHHTPITSPPNVHHTPITSPPNVHHTPITSPPNVHHTPITSPPNVHHTPITSPPNVHHTPITSPPNVHHTPITSPPNVHHTPITSPPNVHHTPITSSSNVHYTPIMSPENVRHTPITSPPNVHHTPITSPPNVRYTPITSPPNVRYTPITSPENVRYTPITSPENVRYTPITSPPNVRYTPITSPENVRYTPITSPENVHHTPITSPPNVHHTPITSPPNVHHTPITSPPNVHHTPITSPPNVHHTPITSPPNVHHTPITSPPNVHHTPITSPPNVHHTPITSSPNVHYTPIMSPENVRHTPITSPPNVHHTPITSPPNLRYTPMTSPPNVRYTPITSPPNVRYTPITSPPNVRYTPITSPENVRYTPITSPENVRYTPITSPPNVRYTPITSPENVRYTPITSPENVRYTPITSPLDFPSPQLSPPPLLSPSQHHLCFQNPEPCSDNPDWIRCEPPAELPYGYSYQNQNQNQNQNQFSTYGDETENTHLPYNHHTHLTSGAYGQVPDQGAWRPTLPQLRCSPLGSGTAGVAPGGWSSMDFNNLSPAEDFSGTQFFHDSYHDNYASQQPFCSPTTPGPSPHYPQTPAVCSPGLQMHPSQERLDFPAEPSRQTLSCCFHDYDSYPVTSDPAQATHRGQDVGGAERAPSLAADIMKQPENKTEVQNLRLLCTVCKRDFRSLPALNGHMRCHSVSRPAPCLNKSDDSSGPVQPSVSIVMPVSVPVQSRGRSKACRGGQKRCSRPSTAKGGAARLYRSLLHPEEEEAGEEVVAGIHYTPPPMLCPLRAGPGLYCSLATGKQQRVQTVQLHKANDGFNDHVAMETASPPPPETLINKPRINVGRGFQAQIPPLRDRKNAASDSHNALLLWTQWDELERPVNQHRVEALLTMARSSVLPGGGANPETALHVLSEFRGDFLLTVEKLLATPPTNNNTSAPLRGRWSAAETRLLVKSLQLHHKDFSRVQRDVQTKSLSECVEFYYLWKRKLSLSARTPARLTVTLPDTNGQRSSRSPDAS